MRIPDHHYPGVNPARTLLHVSSTSVDVRTGHSGSYASAYDVRTRWILAALMHTVVGVWLKSRERTEGRVMLMGHGTVEDQLDSKHLEH